MSKFRLVLLACCVACWFDMANPCDVGSGASPLVVRRWSLSSMSIKKQPELTGAHAIEVTGWDKIDDGTGSRSVVST